MPRDVAAVATGRESLFSSLRRDIDGMLSFFGLSQGCVRRTHLGDNDLGGHHEEPDQAPHRELHHSDEEQRDQASVPGLRAQERDEQGGRRVLPLDAVPVVPLAQRACGDVDPASLWSALHKIAYSRGGQYELIATLREVARAEIERITPAATPLRRAAS